MPNDVRNILKMDGIAKRDFLFGEDMVGKKILDFEKLIPMPKELMIADGGSMNEEIMYYFTNKGTIALNDIPNEDQKAIKNIFKYTFLPPEFELESAMKETENMTDQEKDNYYNEGKKYVDNYKKYGFPTWYGWRCEKWGTKWNAYDLDIINDNEIHFSTAWSAPEPYAKELSLRFPKNKIQLYWADEERGYNTGWIAYRNGQMGGGYYPNESQSAYENYILCWGEDDCLGKDGNGNWYKKECSECGLCD